MEFAQAFLTAVIEVVAIAGFGGCVIHALYTSHKRCQSSAPQQLEETIQEKIPVAFTTQAAEEPIVVEQAIAQQQQAEDQLQPAQEEANAVAEKVVMLTEAEIDAAFKVPVLRALCDQHGIVWKDVRGKNKHALKPAMIQALMSANAF